MIGRLTEEQLVQIRRRESDEFISYIRRTELAQVESKVPSAWIALARAPGPDSARAVLGDLSTHLPRFVDYVSASIAGCAIAEVDAGLPILVMYFPDWVEKDIDKLVGGACVAGVPSEAAALSRFEHSVGRLPENLRRLWSTFSFLSLKDGAKSASRSLSRPVRS